LKPGGASATPKSRKIPVFDCAVALCTMQNALLVISNLTCHSLPLSNRYWMVALKTYNEVMFFISVMPSEIRRSKFRVRWLCDDHIAADSLRVETFLTPRYDSYLSALSKESSFQRSALYWLPPTSWLTIRAWGRLSVQGAAKRVKWSISHSLRAAVYCLETARPSSLHVSIIWFSCQFGLLIWGRCLPSLRPMDFNKRLENAFDHFLANEP
jgi:hypothetical protein